MGVSPEGLPTGQNTNPAG